MYLYIIHKLGWLHGAGGAISAEVARRTVETHFVSYANKFYYVYIYIYVYTHTYTFVVCKVLLLRYMFENIYVLLQRLQTTKCYD